MGNLTSLRGRLEGEGPVCLPSSLLFNYRSQRRKTWHSAGDSSPEQTARGKPRHLAPTCFFVLSESLAAMARGQCQRPCQKLPRSGLLSGDNTHANKVGQLGPCSPLTVSTSASSTQKRNGLSVHPGPPRPVGPSPKDSPAGCILRATGFRNPPPHHHLKPEMMERPGNDGDHPVSKRCQAKFIDLHLNTKHWIPRPFPSGPIRELPREVGAGQGPGRWRGAGRLTATREEKALR